MGLISREEVAKHCYENDCWIVIEGNVLNVTEFMSDHPGTIGPIYELAGQDATLSFRRKPHTHYAVGLTKKYKIGETT
jgi:cytochrome b involved in lipid metabolism